MIALINETSDDCGIAMPMWRVSTHGEQTLHDDEEPLAGFRVGSTRD
jgi:hypothetical protein